jgi:hypothetical protein
MSYEYIMNAATVLFFICYIPELYANYHNKNANIYNLPEKVLILCGTTLAFVYACINDDKSLMINYGPLVSLDAIALGMRMYYVYKNRTIMPEILTASASSILAYNTVEPDSASSGVHTP